MEIKRWIKKKMTPSVTKDLDKVNVSKSPLLDNLEENIAYIKNELGSSTDLVIRELDLLNCSNRRAALIYVEGLVDSNQVQDHVLKPLISEDFVNEIDQIDDLVSFVKNKQLSNSNLSERKDYEDSIFSILNGSTLILFNGYKVAIAADTAGSEQRSVSPPEDQAVLRGPRESFTENIRTNTALIRKKIKNKNLWISTKKLGSVSHTNVAVIYIKGIASDEVVQNVEAKLESIQIDGVLDSGIIEQLIEDSPLSPFPTIYHSERPDIIAAGLMEGRVAVAVDGSPFVLIAPAVFIQFFQAPEDYYERTDYGLLRLLRIFSFFIALVGPSLYIALTTFHQEMIPTELFISIAAGRQSVPFPTVIEALIMESTFEILREAGLRMPRAVGQAVSIVGALVIGQAAVDAGIISPSMVIVVSITAIASFVLPAYNMGLSVRILRFPLMIISASFGLFGIFIGLGLLIIHLCSLQSFGVPYLSPVSPFKSNYQQDTLVRFPKLGLLMPRSLIKKLKR